jgi:hypothetical protein
MVSHQLRADPPVRADRWWERLFPTSLDAVPGIRAVVLTLAVLATATLAEIVRQRGVGALTTLYAEDGTIFLRAAVTHHQGLLALPQPYMGYIHTVPRLLGALAAIVPLEWAAALLSGSGALIVAGLALLVFRASAAHLRSTLARALLAATLIFLPVATAEVLDNVANLHWFLIYAAFWVLLWKTDRAWELAVGLVVVFLAGASDPLALLLAPVAVLRVVSLRGVRNHIFTAAWCAGLVLQAAGIVLGQAHRNLLPPVQLARLAGWYLFDVVGRAVFGTQLLGDAHALRGRVLAAVALLALAALGVIAARTGVLRHRPLAVLAVAMSLIYFVVPVTLTGVSAPRYSVVPILLILTAVACVLDRPSPAATAALFRAARVTAIALLAIVWAVEFQVHNARSVSVRWTDELARAEATCVQGSANADIPIAPPGWDVELACGDLVGR